MMIRFVIPGEPQGKGRPKFSRQGNFVKTYTPAKTENYEAHIKACFMASGAGMIPQGVETVSYTHLTLPTNSLV